MSNGWETRADNGAPARADQYQEDRSALEHAVSLDGDRTVQVGELDQPLRNDFNRQREQQNPPPAKQEEDIPIEELRKGYLRQQDYTRKTQEAARLRDEAEQRLLEAQRVQAQAIENLTRLNQAPQQANPSEDFLLGITPEELAQYPPDAQAGIKAIARNQAEQNKRTAEQLRREFTAALQQERTQSKVAEVVRQQSEFVQNNPSVQLTPAILEQVYRTIGSNPSLGFEDAVRFAAPTVYNALVIERYERQRQSEAKRQQQAGSLASRSAIGAASVFRPGESMRDSFMASYGGSPDATPEALDMLARR